MDALILPQTVEQQMNPQRQAFRRYSSLARSEFKYSGFYYIGRTATHIEKLVKMYERGYSSDTPDIAKKELIRSLEQEQNNLPEVIICEATFPVASIQRFNQFLRQHPVLSLIPVMLNTGNLSPEELEVYKTNIRPDELLNIKNCDEQTLHNKVRFFRRMKGMNKKKALIEERENYIRTEHLRKGLIFKRAFDILVASIALLVLFPLFLLIAIAIKLESKGPVFYIAKRAGRGYKIFNFYKFRTMVHDADKKIRDLTHLNQYGNAQGPVFFKISNDPRITRIGAFLRNTSLDELPQLINVLLGDMSLVGNRPLPLYEAATLTTDDYAARFLAPAGITGLWQVKKRGQRDMSVEERISMDINYASKCNFATDLWIIANTPSALFQKENV
jgi:lipopolysaccharide/colanic/teichoic acid biosynthesis glycosyltransferase